MIEAIYHKYEYEINDKNIISTRLKSMKDSFISSDEVGSPLGSFANRS